MFRKINHVFRPNQQGARGGAASDGVAGSEQDYHSACTVRLVRSSSVVAVGGRGEAGPAVTRSRSTGSGGSEGRWPQRQEDPLWLPSQSRHCLEYLEALVELRRTYTRSVGDFSRSEAEEASAPPGKKPPPPPPPGGGRRGATLLYPPGKTPPEPPVPDEEDCLRYLDAVIASCDSEAQTKAYSDDGHADVDFIVASTSAQHGLHSNWVLRVPRVAREGEQKAAAGCPNQSAPKRHSKGGSTSSRLRLQRNPIHLPKVVESALQTLRFKPRLKKH